jgi:membrane-associated phospholipid phosphatase
MRGLRNGPATQILNPLRGEKFLLVEIWHIGKEHNSCYLPVLGTPFVTTKQLFCLWFVFFCVTVVGVGICIRWLDIPIALFFLADRGHFAKLEAGLSGPILAMAELVLIIGLAIVRMARGSLPEFAKAIFVASCGSLLAFLANDYGLKFIFGRRIPYKLFHSVPDHVFNFFEGSRHSSFPSGHMVMATAFGVALIHLQPRTWPFVLILLCIGAIGLIIGDWHFVGDVIAGAFVGATVGLAAGWLWLERVERNGIS